MSISGFDLAQARYDGATPPEHTMTDDPGTTCPGPDDPCEYLIKIEDGGCYLCGGEVYPEHDETEKCDGYVVHEVCHRQGCDSVACEEDRRDDALLARAEQ